MGISFNELVRFLYICPKSQFASLSVRHCAFLSMCKHAILQSIVVVVVVVVVVFVVAVVVFVSVVSFLFLQSSIGEKTIAYLIYRSDYLRPLQSIRLPRRDHGGQHSLRHLLLHLHFCQQRGPPYPHLRRFRRCRPTAHWSLRVFCR